MNRRGWSSGIYDLTRDQHTCGIDNTQIDILTARALDPDHQLRSDLAAMLNSIINCAKSRKLPNLV